ncbi:MAG: hypothetical protein JO206_07475 [Solirubrobacterales bacterium]|nr:hypothetical protein [Solirubrobacterales bacterium]MBV9817621.1 hypothetical protein [Solirubrobacterales bacterium]
MAVTDAEVTTTLTLPSVIEKEIESRVTQAWAAEGYVTEDGARDPEKMHAAAYKVVIEHVVASKADRADSAISKGQLAAAVFPKAPGMDGTYDQLDEFDRKVYEILERDVWSLTQPKESGTIQKRLGEEDSSLVLLRATIRRKLDKVQVCYITDNLVLIKEDGIDKEIKAWERKADNLRKELNMIMRRHSELEGYIRGEVGQGLARAKATLTIPPSSVGDNNGLKELSEGGSK